MRRIHRKRMSHVSEKEIKSSFTNLIGTLVGMQSSVTTLDQLLLEHERLCGTNNGIEKNNNGFFKEKFKDIVKSLYEEGPEVVDEKVGQLSEKQVTTMASEAINQLKPIFEFFPDPK